jgi:hypothetical protein
MCNKLQPAALLKALLFSEVLDLDRLIGIDTEMMVFET